MRKKVFGIIVGLLVIIGVVSQMIGILDSVYNIAPVHGNKMESNHSDDAPEEPCTEFEFDSDLVEMIRADNTKRLFRKVSKEERDSGMVYFHHHMPRTGGDTLDATFQGKFGRKGFTWKQFGFKEFPSDLPRVLPFYASHVYLPFWDHLEWFYGIERSYRVLILRNPTDRVISSYTMMFGKTGTTLQGIAKLENCLKSGATLTKVTGDPKSKITQQICPLFSNLYVERMCLARALLPSNPVNNNQNWWNRTTESQYEYAVKNLYNKFDFVWITERFDDSYQLFNYLTGEQLTLSRMTHITSQKLKAPFQTAHFRHLIQNVNTWDFKLWKLASEEFDVAFKNAFPNGTNPTEYDVSSPSDFKPSERSKEEKTRLSNDHRKTGAEAFHDFRQKASKGK